MTTAKRMKFLMGYNMKIKIYGGGELTLVGRNKNLVGEGVYCWDFIGGREWPDFRLVPGLHPFPP